MRTCHILFSGISLLAMSSCQLAPTIPFYDRQTVMEAESAGEWPDFEERLLQKSISKGPIFLPKETDQKGRSRALNILHGEMLEGDSN